MKKWNSRGLGFSLLLAMLGTGLIAALGYSLAFYRLLNQSELDKLEHTSSAVVRPIANLATRSVNGGNLMKLRSSDSTALYLSSEVKYLLIEGVSKGSPKTAFSAALPPRPIEYEFVAEGIDAAAMRRQFGDLDGKQVDEGNWLYAVAMALPEVTNGGRMVAVFSAESLQGAILRTVKSVAVTSLIMLCVTLVAAVVLGRLISRPVIAISTQIREISDSLDLSRRVDVARKNEVGEMAGAFNLLVAKLQGLIGEVDSSTARVSSAVGNIDRLAHGVNERIQQQQAETALVATAMNEMTAVAEEVAQNAGAVAKSARGADEQVGVGKQVVEQTVGMIERLSLDVQGAFDEVQQLSVEAENVGGVLEVIRGIAEQTNLLALNAAIEAARAGESGRGFAVVADEVRGLASRTQQATEEIRQMIERLQSGASEVSVASRRELEQVKAAVEQATAAGQSLSAIEASVASITEMTDQIALSVKEQASVAEEINRNIVRIDHFSEQTVTDVNGNVCSAEELSAVAAHLEEQVRAFHT
jgi:methyl-accepting chemotaxis protein